MSEIVVQYFAAARELAQTAEETLVLPAPRLTGSELRALLAARHPALAAFLPRMRLAVNDELSAGEPSVAAGDRVAVLPPVAGGSEAGALRCELRDQPLSLDEAFRFVSQPSAGGVALFVGVVRDHADGKRVARLDYEAHATLAQTQLVQIARDIAAKHPGVRVCALHRVGQLAVGELAVIVATSAAHREQAFASCREAIERIKAEVAIWKKEWDAEGKPSWVNL